ncbi:hypothetical protein D9611_009448 [Ephemerocybe angulata]|uniref:Fungal-type protein kinase domain-containing protein n=1 Tax=Ephemerocybe angulata TaxID=980116 RepID=A0A8H5AWU7_9AGAR|nr:hypothetical protein D9611_009448 [Tulosesus angulatus]
MSETRKCGVNCLHSEEPIHSNIMRIHYDLDKTQVVELKAMLKALIMLKRKREDRAQDEKPMPPEELSEYGDDQLRILVGEAVDFCNDPARSGKLIGQLEESAVSDLEDLACYSIAIGLNSVLIDFKGRDIGCLKMCAHKDLTLYNTGSNVVLDSKLLMQVSDGKSKTNPDIYEARYEDLLKYRPELGTLSFEELAAVMETNEQWSHASNTAAVNSTGWSELVSCIEVKRSEGTWRELLRQKWERRSYSTQSLRQYGETSSPTTQAPSITVANPSDTNHNFKERPNLKRSRDRDGRLDGPLSKKSKTSSSGEAPITPLRSAHPGRLPAEIQCTFYGLELLRSQWDRTHSIVTLLSDDEFSLRWYDSQGCIRTYPISLCGDDLPLAVATIILLQRFQTSMRGRANIDLKVNLNGKATPFGIPSDARPRWEVPGRRSLAVQPVPLGIPSEGKSSPVPETALKNCFFKWYWRESDREPEKKIVDTAKSRARKYLPPQHVSDVLDHLPEIYYSEDFEHLSTRRIREYAIVDSTGSLVPCAMMSRRLYCLEKSFSPDELQVQIWEIFRCLTLMWSLGISHGDISLDNIMSTQPAGADGKSPVLNDFDLAVIMDPGDESPCTAGSELTGTKPFMAMDLLNRAGKHSSERLLRHDIESTLWSLAWYCCRKWEWNTGTYCDVFESKTDWLRNVDLDSPDDGVEDTHISLWRSVAWTLRTEDLEVMELRYAARRARPKYDAVRKAKDFLVLCEKMFPREERYQKWDWMEFAVRNDKGVRVNGE